jgi:hypothetical protein
MTLEFPDVIEIVPEQEQGVAKIKHVTVTPRDAQFASMRREHLLREGTYCQLFVNGQLVMSDTPYERSTNGEIRNKAHGRVLIAGLGVGLILKPILENPEVEYVKVVEKHQDVIDLVAPHYTHDKLEVVCADIFHWKPEKGEKYNVIYFDIWPNICTDSLEDIAKLHQRGKFWLDRSDPKRWMDSWMRDYLKYEKRRESRYYW